MPFPFPLLRALRRSHLILCSMPLAACAPTPAPPEVPIPPFEDMTAGSGVDFRYTFGDDEFSFILEDTGSGVAVLDYDGDGYLDIYFVNGTWLDGISDPRRRANAGARNQLYRNRGDGSFENVTAKAGVGDGGYGMGAVVGDYDADGDEDLVVMNYGPNVAYRNNGDGTFSDVTAQLGLAGPDTLNGFLKWSVNGFFFDYDVDGDLDLYVANYLAFDPRFVDPELPEEYPYPGPESYAGQASLLYRNDDGTFTDVTADAGLLREGGKTMGAAPADFDGDGYPDVLEAVDSMPNFLFHNRGDGTFTEAGLMAGVAFDGHGTAMASMHPCIGDYDDDGKPDLFVPDLDFGCLYRNKGHLLFEEVSESAGITPKPRGSGWGGHFADFDNDGNLDLLVVLGGAFSLEGGEADRLFLNDGKGHLLQVPKVPGGYFGQRHVSRGAAFGDFDNDGDIDFVVNRKDIEGTPNLVRNDLAAGHHWLQLRLVGQGRNRDAVGARITLTAGGRTQHRVVERAGSYLSQNDVRVHFGLGTASAVERLVVRWPGGDEETMEVPGVDRILVLEETGS